MVKHSFVVLPVTAADPRPRDEGWFVATLPNPTVILLHFLHVLHGENNPISIWICNPVCSILLSMSVEFLTNREIYEQVIQAEVPEAKQFLWIATADIKDMYVHKACPSSGSVGGRRGSRMVPFSEILADLVEEGVQVRLLHAKEPGPNFREDFDKYPVLFNGLELVLCPRVHFKSVVVDGRFAYSGSANLTGAGMGAKGENKRNFENGFATTDSAIIEQIMDQFDEIWMGSKCESCQRKDYCATYPELLGKH